MGNSRDRQPAGVVRSDLRRLLGWLLPLAILCSYADAASNGPLEYVDDQTGASVITVNRPLIFVHKKSETINGPRDYVTLAAAAVDRSGKYSYELIAYFWAVGVAADPASGPMTCKPLALQVEDGRIDLAPQDSPHEAGIGLAVHKPPFGAKEPCVYDTELAVFKRLAATPHPVLFSEGQSVSTQYDLFEDRLNALKELVERLDAG